MFISPLDGRQRFEAWQRLNADGGECCGFVLLATQVAASRMNVRSHHTVAGSRTIDMDERATFEYDRNIFVTGLMCQWFNRSA